MARTRAGTERRTRSNLRRLANATTIASCARTALCAQAVCAARSRQRQDGSTYEHRRSRRVPVLRGQLQAGRPAHDARGSAQGDGSPEDDDYHAGRHVHRPVLHRGGAGGSPHRHTNQGRTKLAEIKDFEQSNFTWKLGWPAPQACAGRRARVLDLPVHKYAERGGSWGGSAREISISCWKLTEDELKAIAETGVVWLHVWTWTPGRRY